MLVYRTGRRVAIRRSRLVRSARTVCSPVRCSRDEPDLVSGHSGLAGFRERARRVWGDAHSVCRGEAFDAPSAKRNTWRDAFAFLSRIFRINGIGSVTPRPFQTNHAARSPGCRFGFEGKRFVWILSDPGYSVLISAIWRSFRNVLLIQQADRSDESYTL